MATVPGAGTLRSREKAPAHFGLGPLKRPATPKTAAANPPRSSQMVLSVGAPVKALETLDPAEPEAPAP